jgi:nucleoside-diphosphate-sugar epimerase
LLLGAASSGGRSCSFISAAQRGSVQQKVQQSIAVDRRTLAVLLGGAAGLSVVEAEPAEAAGSAKIVVAGATGQTGRRIVERLSNTAGVQTVATVRDIAKGKKALSESSITVRGAMIEQVGSVDTSGVELKALDVSKDSVAKMVETLQGASSLVIATGFVPGNPFAMNEEAKKVDNIGTKLLVDAAKQAGVKKVVLVSSILTNGRAWGQENSPGFVVTNAFGNVLDEKLVAEKYLRASGLDWTIVRPGGLKATPPSGNLVVSKEDTLNGGEISRDLVADVCVAALFDDKASNKVVEIIEDESTPKNPSSAWFA